MHDIVRAAVPDATRTRAVLGDLAGRFGQVVTGLASAGLTRMFPPPAILAGADFGGLPISDTTVHALRSFAQTVVDRSWLKPEIASVWDAQQQDVGRQ